MPVLTKFALLTCDQGRSVTDDEGYRPEQQVPARSRERRRRHARLTGYTAKPLKEVRTQALLYVVDFSSSCAAVPAFALAGFFAFVKVFFEDLEAVFF